MAAPQTLLLRAETGDGVGLGHLARCLHLATAWVRRRGRAVLVSETVPAPWKDRAERAGVELVPPAAGPGAVGGPAWVVVDGYGLTSEERSRWANGRPLLAIDDFGASPPHAADLVLDQNAGASAEPYAPAPTLLGPRYALLDPQRRDVVAKPAEARRAPVRRVVVSLGGTVPPERADRAQRILGTLAIELADPLHVEVLDGTQDLAEVLADTDFALAAAGSTCWDLCRFAVPMVIVTVAANQEPVARALGALGAAVDGGALVDGREAEVADVLRSVATDAGRRVSLATTAGALVDGWGADRVATRLRSEDLTLRPVAASDAALLLAWRNDPVTRAASFETGTIAPEAHEQWLARALTDPTAVHRLAADHGGDLVGVVRFDGVEDGRAEIGVNVAPERRGEGWAAALIDAGCRAVRRERGPLEVRARIKPDNERSVHAFRAADFDPVDPLGAPGPLRWHEYSRRDDDAD